MRYDCCDEIAKTKATTSAGRKRWKERVLNRTILTRTIHYNRLEMIIDYVRCAHLQCTPTSAQVWLDVSCLESKESNQVGYLLRMAHTTSHSIDDSLKSSKCCFTLWSVHKLFETRLPVFLHHYWKIWINYWACIVQAECNFRNVKIRICRVVI